VVFGVVAVWHSLQSTGSPGEIPGHLHQPMNRGRGRHLCRICKQNQSWLRGAAEPDSGILGLEAGEDVKSILSLFLQVQSDPFPFLSVANFLIS